MAATVAIGRVPIPLRQVGESSRDRGVAWELRQAQFAALTDSAIVCGVLGLGLLASSPDVTTHGWVPAVVVAVAWLVGLALGRCWDVDVLAADPVSAGRVVRMTLATCGTLALALVAVPWGIQPEPYIAYSVVIGLVLLLLARWARSRRVIAARRNGECQTDVVVVGDATGLAGISRVINGRTPSRFRVAGVCSTEAPPREFHGLEFGAPGDALDLAVRVGATALLVAPGSRTSEAISELRWEAAERGLSLFWMTGLEGVSASRLRVMGSRSGPLVQVARVTPSTLSRAVKRGVDVVGSALLLVVLAPVMAAVALVLKASSPGPVIFRQERIGIDGTPFKIYKFRSMVPGAEALLESVLDGEVGVFYKPKSDPRVTPLGRFLRRTSLDELPQLFNVLLGSMSLVGPRPQISAEVSLYDSYAHRRLNAKPGITGLWQVSGRNSLSVEESIGLDVLYVDNWSLTSDLAILALTPGVVARCAGSR